jgi:hypothetical protein
VQLQVHRFIGGDHILQFCEQGFALLRSLLQQFCRIWLVIGLISLKLFEVVHVEERLLHFIVD